MDCISRSNCFRLASSSRSLTSKFHAQWRTSASSGLTAQLPQNPMPSAALVSFDQAPMREGIWAFQTNDCQCIRTNQNHLKNWHSGQSNIRCFYKPRTAVVALNFSTRDVPTLRRHESECIENGEYYYNFSISSIDNPVISDIRFEFIPFNFIWRAISNLPSTLPSALPSLYEVSTTFFKSR